MLTVTQRLGTLDAKAKLATRTAKDGEGYSQLVFEVTEVEVDDTEVNAIFSTPQAYVAMKALHKAVKGIKAIELEEKFEGATVVVRLAAVSAVNGSEFTFSDCRIDKIKFGALESESMMLSYRVTAKPALDVRFGELVSRFGHTAIVELRADSPLAQKDLPLNSFTDGGEQVSMSNTGRQIQAAAAKKERKARRDAAADSLN